MKYFLIICFSTAFSVSFCQDTLDLPLKHTVKTIKYDCRLATAADVCKTKIFRTRQPDLFYKINYDLQNRVHSQGAVIKEKMQTADSKKNVDYFEVGIWRYYNYDANEIIFYRCMYSDKPGCSVLSREELKKEKIE